MAGSSATSACSSVSAPDRGTLACGRAASLSEYRVFETDQFLADLEAIARGGHPKVLEKLRGVVYPQLASRPHFGPNIRKLRGYSRNLALGSAPGILRGRRGETVTDRCLPPRSVLTAGRLAPRPVSRRCRVPAHGATADHPEVSPTRSCRRRARPAGGRDRVRAAVGHEGVLAENATPAACPSVPLVRRPEEVGPAASRGRWPGLARIEVPPQDSSG
jgi:hypothetical protein